MLQILIDPSMLAAQSAQKGCELSIAISGCYWTGEVPEFNDSDERERFMERFFPWKWAAPKQIKVFWLNEENKVMKEDLIDVIPKGDSIYQTDHHKVISYYESMIKNKVYDHHDQTKINSRHLLPIVGHDPSKELILDIDDLYADSPLPTHFLSSTIAQFAQKLIPHNSFGQLVFFSKDENVFVPYDTVKYFAVPVGFSNEENWSDEFRIFYGEGADEKEYLTPPPTNDAEPRILIPINTDYIKAKYFSGGPQMMELLCPITPISVADDGQSQIQLRDQNGAFLGHVKNIEVHDSELLFKRSIFIEKILSQLSPCFNFPVLLYEFLFHHKEILLQQNENWLSEVNKLLQLVLRDSIGIGNPLYENGQTILLEIIKEYNHAEGTTKIGVENPDEVKKLMDYFIEYDKITPEVWSSMITLEQELLTSEMVFPEIETGTDSMDEKKLEEWLSIWKKMIQKVQSVYNNDLAKIQFNQFFKTLTTVYNGLSPDKFTTIVDEYFKNNFILIENSFLKSLLININKYGCGFGSEDVENLKKDSINYIKNYVDERIFPGILNKNDPFTLYPVADDAIKILNFNEEPIWKPFKDFIEEYFQRNIEDREWIKIDLDETLKDILQNTTDVPPQVLIKVDSLENHASSLDPNEDLSNEISGHIILQQRSREINQNNFEGKEWRTLNFSKVNLVEKENKTIRLSETYLIPAFLPEEDDFKTTYFSISNENLSIIAGHDNFDDTGFDDEDFMPFQFSYVFDNSENGVSNTISSAYALWYGYHYNFADFVALNSGVLPAILRKGDDWITPAIGQQVIAPENIKNYHHLRRVAIGKAHAEIAQFKPIPDGLLPLSCELPEWDEQPVYLLSNHQTGLTIQIGKPTTNFWNWYAWLGESNEYLSQCLTREIEIKESHIKKGQFNDYLIDPAVDDEVIVIVEQIFPEHKLILKEHKLHTIKINLAEIEGRGIRENITVTKSDDNQIIIDDENKTINIPDGFAVNIRIHSKVPEKYFKSTDQNQRFYGWMSNLYEDVKEEYLLLNTGLDLSEFEGFYFTRPVEMFFEAAITSKGIIKDKTEYDEYGEFLWKNLSPFETEKGKQVALNVIKFNDEPSTAYYNYRKLAYFSRTKVNHQVWHWNGRLFDDSLIKIKDPAPEKLDPSGFTTEAMKWEAWEFSDRPDSSSLESTTHLIASRIDNRESKKQTLFTDNRILDNKALYYRFSAELFSRYELLGRDYQVGVQSFTRLSEGKTVRNQWRRYVKKSNKSDNFPKPAIRFAIPLTHSIEECPKSDGITSASVLIVLKDTWFSEAGLAEKLEVGVDVLEYAEENFTEKAEVEMEVLEPEKKMYLNAGNDPILSGNGIGNIDIAGKSYYEEEDQMNLPKVIFQPSGPAGLTFDFGVSTPKIIGSSFILKMNNINQFIDNKENGLKGWSMAQISVRRSLHDNFWTGKDLKSVKSEWSAKEWVQFLPDTNSMIPMAWRKEVANYGSVKFRLKSQNLMYEKSVMPHFQDFSLPNTYEQRTERYLVITERIQNMGGQPFEKYQAVYKYTDDNDFKFNDGDVLDKDNFEGYVRVLVVRVMPESPDHSIWTKLFGEDKEFDFSKIQNDPDAALPLISKRIPIMIQKA